MKWLRDESFIRGKIPMTKFEIRTLVMAMLAIEEHDTLLDIGAGTGSISIQAALWGATVYAIETKTEGIDLIQQNAEKHQVSVQCIHGTAPEAIAQVPTFTKCFIGGSKGQLESIVECAHHQLEPGGLLVATFIIPENLMVLTQTLQRLAYQNVETRLVQASVLNSHGMMLAQNPVFIVGAQKI